MDLRSHISGDIPVLQLAGRFDNYVAPSVAEWLEKHISVEHSSIVVDLEGVTFIDSTALATLVQGLNRCRKLNGNLHLCGMRQQVYMIFELTRLDKAFNIFVDENHAIQAING
jgi:anti-sigma B factor antagonist